MKNKDIKKYISKLKNRKIMIMIILILVCVIIFVIKHNEILENVTKIIKGEDISEETKQFSYFVYDNREEDKIKTFITINSESGIEYVKCPNENVIYTNGSDSLSIDYETTMLKEYDFYIKEVDTPERKETLYIDDEKIQEASLSIDIINDAVGYEKIQLKNKIKFPEYNKIYYKIGKDGSWVEGTKFSIFDYDLKQKELINENSTITISAKVVNNINNDEVLISKDIEIDNTEVTESIEDESLLKAIERENLQTGKYKLNISDEIYDAKIYNIVGDVNIDMNTVFGSAEDVGASNKYAQNMIVLKVKGNLTIEKGTTVTSYNSAYGGPKGMLLYVTGDIINEGTISMTARGAYAEGQNIYLWCNSDNNYELVPKDGANGGAAIMSYSTTVMHGINGNAGGKASDRKTGGRR